MSVQSVLHSLIRSVLHYCALQREMAERELALYQRAQDRFDRETHQARRPSATNAEIWDEWEMRHSR